MSLDKVRVCWTSHAFGEECQMSEPWWERQQGMSRGSKMDGCKMGMSGGDCCCWIL
jgi:hypothetical protein